MTAIPFSTGPLHARPHAIDRRQELRSALEQTGELADLLQRSGRLLRSASRRVEDQRTATLLRRLANRRRRAARMMARTAREPRVERQVAPAGGFGLVSSVRADAVLRACADHDRIVLHALSRRLEAPGLGRVERLRLGRLRNVIERDVARFRAARAGAG